MTGTFKFDSKGKGTFVFRPDSHSGNSVSYDNKDGWGVWIRGGHRVKVSENLFEALEILEGMEG